MKDLQTLFAESAAMHRNRLCPRQVLGVRMGVHAGDLLGLELPHPEKRLFIFVETDGCGLDGISVATGCTVGHRNMRILDFGKMAATFVDRETNEAIRIVPRPESRMLARDYMPDIDDRWQAQLQAYQIMPAEELFKVAPVLLSVSVDEIVSTHGLRISCEICGEEIMNHREEKLNGKTVCRSCAGAAYYVRPGTFQPKVVSRAGR